MLQQPIKVLLVDDHELIHRGVRDMLESLTNVRKFDLDKSYNDTDALEKIKNTDFDIVLMDYSFFGITGAKITQQMLHHKPYLKILAFSNHCNMFYIKEMMEAGAVGYILKDLGPIGLLKAIEKVLNGRPCFASEVSRELLNNFVCNKTTASNDFNLKLFLPNSTQLKDPPFTKRETEVLLLMVKLLPNEQIALMLNISKKTVQNHQQNMRNKVKAKKSSALVKYALEFGLT